MSAEIDLLIFDGPPKPLDKNIIAPSSFSIHADRDVMFVWQVCKGKTGKLAALIGIEHLGLSITCQSLLDGLKTKRGIERDGYTPCEHLTAEHNVWDELKVCDNPEPAAPGSGSIWRVVRAPSAKGSSRWKVASCSPPFIPLLQSSNLGSAKKTVEPEPAEASGAENGAEEALLMVIAGALSLAGANGRDELLIIVAGLTSSMGDVTVTAANVGWMNV